MARLKTSKRPSALFVDDTLHASQRYVEGLIDLGFDVTYAGDVKSALDHTDARTFDLVILDVMMDPLPCFSLLETEGGFKTGVVMARTIRKRHPNLKIIALTANDDQTIEKWFASQPNMMYLQKRYNDYREVPDRAMAFVLGRTAKPKVFIVHGRDKALLASVKRLVRDRLDLGRPIVLAEEPSKGLTVIEKFENAASAVDIVFVLLSPDDFGGLKRSPARAWRARQNVIFELGYFYGRLNRSSGRILLLHKGVVDLPSDLSGLVYIDVSDGVTGGLEAIRNELSKWVQP
jgi:predicted nucleotide-binding protein